MSSRSGDRDPGAEHRFTNRLISEASPYLLQHAHNPVDWSPWGPEALARAKLLDRPIFLSIGYAACHWCHVMERESFEDEATAHDLNTRFVPVKVDREERPDLDQLYMGAVQHMTGSGGWPMTVFLTPEGRPFYGGTYFPPEPRHGLPSFRQLLAGIDRAWREQRSDIESAGLRLVNALAEQQRLPAVQPPATPQLLDTAEALIAQAFDARTGGWGSAPKFPQPMTLEFLLRRAVARPGAADETLAIARRSLDAMADGGVRDQLGGGFHRYATDARWLVPHFEQMLYDNAQLARVYLHASALTGDARYREVARSTLDFIVRELSTADGAFAASLDADTGGVEGGTFTWTAAEVAEVLGGEAVEFGAAYDVTAAGNWEGLTILQRVTPRADDPTEERLAAARTRLLERRTARPQPARDDKALAAWNGLAIAAFAEAVRAGDAWYRGPAETAAVAILGGLYDEATGRLRRSWKDGRATGAGVLEDYACLAEGLLALYEATFEERWFVVARRLADTILERFADPDGGFFDVADDHERLVARPKDVGDNATPSGSAMACLVLLRLAAYTGEDRYRAAVERAMATVTPFLARAPTAFAMWLQAADLLLADIVEVAIVGDPADPTCRALIDAARGEGGYAPHRVVACAPPDAGADSAVPLLAARTLVDGQAAAYVCRGFACRLPVTSPEALVEQARSEIASHRS